MRCRGKFCDLLIDQSILTSTNAVRWGSKPGTCWAASVIYVGPLTAMIDSGSLTGRMLDNTSLATRQVGTPCKMKSL